MVDSLSLADLQAHSDQFAGTGAVSAENRSLGYIPAFRDRDSGAIYLSCDSRGNVSPVHQFQGLPEEVVKRRDEDGRILEVKSSLVPGFVSNGEFLTREQCAERLVRDALRISAYA